MLEKMQIKLPDSVKYILDTLNKFGYASYVVGGCVRDSILGIEPKDWDITTNATPTQIKEVFKKIKKPRNYKFGVIPTGEKYGTVTLFRYSTKETYEVTTFRYDQIYSDGRRPDNVIFGNSIYDDLARRDFTMNAIAYNELVGFVDPYNGIKDIENKIIKCVGLPEDRFNEDALRMLRAIRFACKYKLRPFSNLLSIINNNSDLVLKNISKERITNELIQILHYIKGNKYIVTSIYYLLQKLFELEVYSWIESYNFGKLIYSCCNNDNLEEVKLFNILKNCKNIVDAEIWLRKYKFPNLTIKRIIHLYKIDNLYKHKKKIDNRVFIKYLLKSFPKQDVLIYFNQKKKCKITNQMIEECLLEPYDLSSLNINGEDLKKLGIKEGEQIGFILNALLDIVIKDSNLNNKETLSKIVIKEYFKNT